MYIRDYFHPYVEEGHTEARPLRVLYKHRWIQTVNTVVLQYSLLSQDNTFKPPTKEDLEKHKVVVTTLSVSRYLYELDLEPGKSLQCI